MQHRCSPIGRNLGSLSKLGAYAKESVTFRDLVFVFGWIPKRTKNITARRMTRKGPCEDSG